MVLASDSGNDGSRSLDPDQKHVGVSRDKVLWTSVFVDSVAPFLRFEDLGKFAQTCRAASQIVYDRSSGTTRSVLSSLELTLKRHPSLDDIDNADLNLPQEHVFCAPLLTPNQLNYLDLKRLRVFRVLAPQTEQDTDDFGHVDSGTLSYLQLLIDGLGPNVESFSLTVEQDGGRHLDDTSRTAISQAVIRFLQRAHDLRTLELPGFIFACKIDGSALFDSVSSPAIQKLSFLFPVALSGEELGERITAANDQNQQLLVHALLPKADSLAACFGYQEDTLKWLEAVLPLLSSVKHFSLQKILPSVENLYLSKADLHILRKYVGNVEYPLTTFRTVGVYFRRPFPFSGDDLSPDVAEWADWLEEMMHPDSSLRCIEFLNPNPSITAGELFSSEQYYFLKGLAVGLGRKHLGGLTKFVGDMFPKKEQ